MAGRRPWRRLLPLVLATAATQASIVVLAPLVVEIGRDLGASVSAVGLARSVLAGTAVARVAGDRPADRPHRCPAADSARGGHRLRGRGAHRGGAVAALLLCRARAHGRGRGLPALGGFAGVAASFGDGEAAWAMGWVVGAQSLAWIVGNPIIGVLGGGRLVAALIRGARRDLRSLALRAGLAAPRTEGTVAARGEGASIRDGLAAVFRDPSARRWSYRRAGGLLRMDRGAHLRRRVLHRDLRRRRGGHRAAAGHGLGRVPDHLPEHRAPDPPRSPSGR